MKNSPNKNISLLAYFIAALTAINFLFAEDKGSDSKNGKIKVLLIDGQNNHDWVRCSPVMIDTLKATGKFEIERATVTKSRVAEFNPDFTKYHVIPVSYTHLTLPTIYSV